MAATLSGTIRCGVYALYTGTEDLGTLVDTLPFASDITYTNGTGAAQSDLKYSKTRTIAASTTDSLDLSGSLTDVFGTTLNFVEVTLIYFLAAAANNDVIRIGGAAANAFVGPWPVGHKIDLAPGEPFLIGNIASTSGWAVTAGTADILEVENVDGAVTADYDIVLLGRSA